MPPYFYGGILYNMHQRQLLPHLFRTEFGKITAVLCKHFSIHNIEIAEDIASDTFLSAIENWTYTGIPENPEAWLYTVAKNKAKTYFQRQKTFTQKVLPELKEGPVSAPQGDIDLSDKNIFDSQLQMLFVLCHPSIPPESQSALALRILCGFGIEEIANAYLANSETIKKRLSRAKEKLRSENLEISMPSSAEIQKRLDSVLTTLYLLFNEGYYSESDNAVVREDLCDEAIRLATLLTKSTETNKPKVNALLSLMYFHSSRFAARKDKQGEIVLYEDQDESLWSKERITRGIYFLKEASQGDTLSRYHLEATIAFWHTQKEDTAEKWDNILSLYNHLLQIQYSPVAALNRTYALSKVQGKELAIKEAEKLQLNDNQYYFVLLGELYSSIQPEKAKDHFHNALSIAKTEAEKQLIRKKIERLT